jgi:hypothetical protein
MVMNLLIRYLTSGLENRNQQHGYRNWIAEPDAGCGQLPSALRSRHHADLAVSAVKATGNAGGPPEHLRANEAVLSEAMSG